MRVFLATPVKRSYCYILCAYNIILFTMFCAWSDNTCSCAKYFPRLNFKARFSMAGASSLNCLAFSFDGRIYSFSFYSSSHRYISWLSWLRCLTSCILRSACVDEKLYGWKSSTESSKFRSAMMINNWTKVGRRLTKVVHRQSWRLQKCSGVLYPTLPHSFLLTFFQFSSFMFKIDFYSV